jgi:hypothetical protein
MGGLHAGAQVWWGYNLGTRDDFEEPWWMRDGIGGTEEWQERWCEIQGWPREDYAVRTPLLAQVSCTFEWWGHLEYSHASGYMACIKESFRETDVGSPLPMRVAPKSWWHSELKQFMEYLELPVPAEDPEWFVTATMS